MIRRRQGAAAVELAICLPIFFLLTMGTVETCRMLYLRQSVKIAAYECARLGITPDISVDVIRDQCEVLLRGRHIDNFEFSCEPADPGTLEYEDLFSVTVSVPASEAALVGSWVFGDKPFTESVTIMAEY